MTFVSTITYEAEQWNGPTDDYPDLAGRAFEDGDWLIAVLGHPTYIRKGDWILTPSDKPQSRIVVRSDYFRDHYKQKGAP